jgi:hypothetical protein
MYALGRGVSKDYIFAHMWWNICSYNGDKDCVKNINLLEKKMSQTQIGKAKEMARNWQGTETNFLDKDSKNAENETFRAI